MGNLYTISEAAEKIGVSADTIRRWDKKGLIKATRSEHNHRLFNIDEIQRIHDKVSGKSHGNNFKILQSKKQTDFTAIDLFAGAGGTALGMENAGLKHLMLNEWDKHAAATLKKNKPEWNVLHDDVSNVDFTVYRDKVDVIEGGFPCQTFSYAGKKAGFEDTRGTMFYQFARAVKEARPKVAVGENVRGLLTHDGGQTLRVMVGALQELGYRVAYRVLRAQYFDVPQKRERLVIIAVREDVDAPILYPIEKDYTVSLKEAIGDKPQAPGQEYSAAKKAVMALVPEGGYWKDLPLEVQKNYMMTSFFMGGGKTGMARRLAWDEPSLTLTCGPAQKQTERCHPEETRPLNVREYARIQTFPDNWEFVGSVGQQYKQIGNAVPVNLGYYMGMAVIGMLSGEYDKTQFGVVEPLPIVNESRAEEETVTVPTELPDLSLEPAF